MRNSGKPHRGYGLRELAYTGLAFLGISAAVFLGSGGASAPPTSDTQAGKPKEGVILFSEPISTYVNSTYANRVGFPLIYRLGQDAEGRGYNVRRAISPEDLERTLQSEDYSGVWANISPESDGRPFPALKEFAENGGKVFAEIPDSFCREDAEASLAKPSLTEAFPVLLKCRDVGGAKDSYILNGRQIPGLGETSVETLGLPGAYFSAAPDNCKLGYIKFGDEEIPITATCEFGKGTMTLKLTRVGDGLIAGDRNFTRNRPASLNLVDYLAGVTP